MTSTVAGLLLLLILLMLPLAGQAQFTCTTNDGKITITGYTGPGGSATIPSTIDGLPVTAIDGYAFSDCTNLASINLGPGITNIGWMAFTPGTGLKQIAVDPLNPAFSSLDGVLFNKQQNQLLRFPAGKAGSYEIPEGVTNIELYAFSDGDGVTNIVIPTSMTSIGANAFTGCRSLNRVTMPDNVTRIEYDAFAFCSGLASILIPSHVTTIGTEAFYGCGLTNVTIPDSVTNFWNSAFGACTQLTRVLIGKGIQVIPPTAFAGCTKLRDVTITDNITSIENFAFAGCGLTNITIPNSVRSISWFAFNGCTNLLSVTIPNSVTNIGGDSGLTFGRCSSLQRVVIGNRVNALGSATFLNCTNLMEVYCQGDAPSADSDVFTGAANATVFYLPFRAGWGASFGGWPTALWKPRLRTDDGNFGVRTNEFGFNVDWADGMSVVVEGCNDLAHPVWVPLQTNLLTGSLSYFSDPQWTNYPSRIYRAVMTTNGP